MPAVLRQYLGGFYVHSLNGQMETVGANLITISAAILDYDDDWTGRYLNTEVKPAHYDVLPDGGLPGEQLAFAGRRSADHVCRS